MVVRAATVIVRKVVAAVVASPAPVRVKVGDKAAASDPRSRPVMEAAGSDLDSPGFVAGGHLSLTSALPIAVDCFVL